VNVTGTCHVLFAHDVGFSVDLDRAAARLEEARRRAPLRNPRRAPPGEGKRPPPLRVTRVGEPIDLGPARTGPRLEISVHESGAVVVTYAIPVAGPIEDLVALSDVLYDNDALRSDAQGRTEELVSILGDAVARPRVARTYEDYVIFELAPPVAPDQMADLWAKLGPTVARILRAEPGRLSEQEVREALSGQLSYEGSDAALVDWFAALLLGDDTEDERTVLELAIVALLEIRVLDDLLDDAVETAFESLSQRWRGPRSLALRSDRVRRVAEMQADYALLYEGIHNTMKLLGDQYLARLYREAARRFHLAEWEAGVERKLGIVGSIFQRHVDAAMSRRMEILEWIIILLIAVEVLAYFLR
jgi:hypothetical protein